MKPPRWQDAAVPGVLPCGHDAMAKRTSKQPSERSQELLAEKRRAAKILREAGLLRRRAGRITKQYLQESSYLRKLRREFADVISGEVRVAKINKDAARLFKASGYRVKSGRVIVPKSTPRRITNLQAWNISQQPPPPAPPAAARAAQRRQRRDHDFEECLRKITTWFLNNTTYAPQERVVTLVQWARANPNKFRRIVNASHQNGLNYLAGKGPTANWPAADYDDLEDTLSEFRDEFTELYYYHPSVFDLTYGTGSLIPRC